MNILKYLSTPFLLFDRRVVLHWTLLFLLSFVLLLLLSPDSYLADSYALRCDSAWFFTCGKAWMEGMIPYVDFADSKGPLLWLIYGLGYLLSPVSYHGVFWLSVVAYMITLHFVWLTARLFLTPKESAFVLVAIPFFLFLIIYHNEVRAEDFCISAICGGIYFACRELLNTSSPMRGGDRNCFGIGFCLACCLFIKWTCFFMMGGIALAVAAISIQRHKPYNILWGLAGIGIVVLPFIVYFLCVGNLADFVNEYFVNTFYITNNPDGIFIRDKTILTFLFAFIAFFSYRLRLGYWLLIAFLPFYVFLVMRSMFLHYFSVAMPFFVFVLIYIVQKFSCYIHRLGSCVYAALLAVIFLFCIVFNLRISYFTPFSNTDGMRIATMQYLAQTDQPKIMFSKYELGHGLLARALPACKYWAQQKDASEKMMKEREKDVMDRRADFIIISNAKEASKYFIPLVLKAGYHQCYGPVTENGKTEIKPLPLFEK